MWEACQAHVQRRNVTKGRSLHQFTVVWNRHPSGCNLSSGDRCAKVHVRFTIKLCSLKNDPFSVADICGSANVNLQTHVFAEFFCFQITMNAQYSATCRGFSALQNSTAACLSLALKRYICSHSQFAEIRESCLIANTTALGLEKHEFLRLQFSFQCWWFLFVWPQDICSSLAFSCPSWYWLGTAKTRGKGNEKRVDWAQRSVTFADPQRHLVCEWRDGREEWRG